MSEILAKLIAVGTPPDLVAEVALEIARAQAANDVLEQRRESDRRRQRERRAREADHVMSRDIREHNVMSEDSRDVTDIAPLSPSPFLPPQTPQTNPHPHTPGCDSPRARKADPFPCPDGVDAIDWEGLKDNRRKKRAALSAGAHRQIISKLQRWSRDGWPPGPIVAHAVERGWSTVFETDEMKHGHDGNHRHQDTVDPMVAAVARRQAERASGQL